MEEGSDILGKKLSFLLVLKIEIERQHFGYDQSSYIFMKNQKKTKRIQRNLSTDWLPCTKMKM